MNPDKPEPTIQSKMCFVLVVVVKIGVVRILDNDYDYDYDFFDRLFKA